MRKVQIRMLLIILAVLIATPANIGTQFSFAGATEEKYFSQMTQDEKTRVLNDLIAKKVVPNTIKVNGKTYSLSTYNWNNRGVITYGEISAVNAANTTTNFPNYKDGEWRYLGYDMNGGLYGNDDFPPDYPSSSNPQNQTWLTTTQVKNSTNAKKLIGGENTVNADGGYSNSDKLYTASVFLDRNPEWGTAGWTASTITQHFFFNAVFLDNGLTRGQFVGVKNVGSTDSPVLRYQTFSVEITVKFEIPPEVPEEPDPGLPTDPDPDPEEPVVPPPPPGTDITVNASLGLPPVSYTGHPALAQDYSIFNVDGETWSAQQTYSEGLASNRFRAIGESGTVRRIANTKAEVTFANPGNYPVELEVCPDGGEKAIDVKPIEVKPTPTIIHALSGTQKQNRKQVLNLKVAKHPDSTLTEFWVKLEYLDKGESVTLHHKAAGGNTLVNSSSIKTRPIEKLAISDTYYEYCKLEFLLNNIEASNCRYTVYVKDNRGNSDQVTEEFAVSPDKAPVAAITLDGTFIRKPNSDVASITVEDVTSTDGDQVERTWFYRAVEKDQPEGEKGPWVQIKSTDPGYTDYSFGKGKKISFDKIGVGLFEIKLTAKDLWTEETLPEYVDDTARLTGETASASEVINIAPVVGLKALSAKSAEINILTGGEAEYNRVMSNLANLEQELLQQGITAHITVDQMAKAEIVPTSPAAQKIPEVDTPFGWDGNWSFWEDRNFAIDNEKLYKISATWIGEGYDALPSEPYTVGAWDAITGNHTWSSVFTDATLPVNNSRNVSFLVQDDNEDYLFFTSGDKTLVMAKDNGSILTVLDMEIGKNNFTRNNNIYTVKTDGIYSISTITGQVKKLYKGSILEGKSRELGGMIHFVANNGKIMYRGLFDLSTESVSFEGLPAQTYDPKLENSHIVLGIDTDGKIIILTCGKNTTSSNQVQKHVRVYSENNEMIFCSSPHPTTTTYYGGWSGMGGIIPVYNEEGECNYLAFTWEQNGSTYDYVYARVFDIYNGAYLTQCISKKNCSTGVSDGNLNPFVKEINGKVYVSTGANYIYVMNTGAGIYDERCKLFAFDFSAGTALEASINEVGIPLSTIEYGYQSDTFAVVQTGNNWPGLTNGSESHVIAWHRPVEAVVNSHINKNFKAGSDINALIIYDETNPAESYTVALLDSLKQKADTENAKFILASRTYIENGGLGDAILALKEEDSNVLGVSIPEGQTGTMSKVYNLVPGKTYYYEYEVKTKTGEAEDIASFIHQTQDPLNGQFTENSYKVVKSYFEDFEDADNVNPFFTMANKEVYRYSNPKPVPVVSGGYYKGADLVYSSKSNINVTDPNPQSLTALSFTVPEGHQGHLSFDYYLQKADENYSVMYWYRNCVMIDGKLWAKNAPVGHAGHYSHPDLLSPGAHTLTFAAGDYGREGQMKTWLDTIQVNLVKENTGNLPQEPLKETLSIDDPEGGFAHIKGILAATPQTNSFGEVSNAIVSDGLPGTAPYTTITNTVAGRESFELNIPEGKVAIFTRIPTASYTPMDYSVQYKNPTFTYRSSGKTYTANDTWTYGKDGLVASNEVLTARQMNETKSFSLNYRPTRGSRGMFLGITSVMVDQENVGWSNLGFFLTGSGESKKYFLQKEAYDGTELTLTFPEGDHMIRDLKLYYIKNGLKVYADEEPFSDSAALSKWTVSNASASIIKEASPEEGTEEKGLVYKKGEKILYGLSYFDYEGDPAKKQYWKYTHTPFNDGPHPDAAVILNADDEPVNINGKVLNAPIDRFYIDGRYTVEHWQEDNTARPATPEGNPDYDKLSNVVSLTFYVEGGGMAPWIESIKTSPAVVSEGDSFRLQVAVDDTEKDELRLTTEVFYGKELIYIHRKNGISPDAFGKYPPVLTDTLPEPAVTGKYEVVCTVRDLSGAGVGSYRFTVVSEGKITGRINHTDEWEKNRKKYNLHFFNEEYNTPVAYVDYSAMKPPRKRGTNVFWSGERFLLSADVGGDPVRVTAEIDGASNCKTVLSDTGKRNAQNEMIFSGELWDRSMINMWGRNKPEELKFLFKAEYSGGTVKTFEDRVVVDSNTDYWLLHRLW